MRVFIAGMDGYLGWPLAMHLSQAGHEVAGSDIFFRRKWVAEVGGGSATPICPMEERLSSFSDVFGRQLSFYDGDMRQYDFVRRIISDLNPDAIVHLAEQPSAPYSMMDAEHAIFTQSNNVTTTLNLLYAIYEGCPGTHLVKLGTMGEYGTPNVPIPEGFFNIEYRGRTDTLPFPRQAGSWYHLSKVHDSQNIAFACKSWGIRSTDLMQGPVYGTRTAQTGADERLQTRFDFDGVFGTALNRFCAQAVIGFPLTVYGKGLQKRGFINIVDSMRCIQLAVENPPARGEYRVFNQFTEIFSVLELAQSVKEAGERLGLKVAVNHVDDPRVEAEGHLYEADHQKLLDLGLRPHRMNEALEQILADLVKYRDRIEERRHCIIPKVFWSKEKKESAISAVCRAD